jgi:hypothetical protein
MLLNQNLNITEKKKWRLCLNKPNQKFEKIIWIKKPINIIKNDYQLVQQSRKIIQPIDAGLKANKNQLWKEVTK